MSRQMPKRKNWTCITLYSVLSSTRNIPCMVRIQLRSWVPTCHSLTPESSCIKKIVLMRCKELTLHNLKSESMHTLHTVLYTLPKMLAREICLTLYTQTIILIFSTLISPHFLWSWQGEFVWQSGTSKIGDYFYKSHHLDIWFKGDILMRN